MRDKTSRDSVRSVGGLVSWDLVNYYDGAYHQDDAVHSSSIIQESYV